jgi:hypothetical protein
VDAGNLLGSYCDEGMIWICIEFLGIKGKQTAEKKL